MSQLSEKVAAFDAHQAQGRAMLREIAMLCRAGNVGGVMVGQVFVDKSMLIAGSTRGTFDDLVAAACPTIARYVPEE